MARERKPGWWYPYIFVGAFVVVVGVNGTLAFFATSTFTGLQTEGAYEKGLAYNQNLALAKAQQEMGWTVEPTVTPVKAGETRRADIAIRYRDRDGRAVDGMEVKAKLIRPTTKGYDHEVALAARGGGTYGAIIELPLPGVWDMDAVAVGKDVSYSFSHRFVVP